MIHDAAMIFVAWFGAYWLRFNLGVIPQHYFPTLLHVFSLVFIIQLLSFSFFHLYRGVWRFASIPDLFRIIKAVIFASLISLALVFFIPAWMHVVPRSVIPIYVLLLVFLLGGARLLYRWLKDHIYWRVKGQRVLIVGAGQAGEWLLRDMARSQAEYKPIAFVDDSRAKQGREIHGIRVLGRSEDIPRFVKLLDIKMVLIALPSADAKIMRSIVEHCEKANVDFQTLPGLADIADGKVTINALREVSVEDLLGREEIKLDWESIQTGIEGRRVLVTGAGGSIGSELCRQIAQLGPEQLIVVENNEYNLYELESELKKAFPALDLKCYLLDVTDRQGVKYHFGRVKPQLVFHAAAYKHVPILEYQARSAINNNLMGTIVVAEEASLIGVEKFILVSTDKAVNPTNIMGATKRAAEIFCQNFNERSNTQFITTRFGNVIGSKGSVVPLFRKQLALGGPLTVTHPDMMRFFMTIPEATQLILQTTVMGSGGEIFVLDMGEQIKIHYLAEQMIRLSGKEDINIEYIGLRPGEKLYEELFYEGESLLDTQHPKVHKAQSEKTNWEHFISLIDQCRQLLQTNDADRLKSILVEIVPNYEKFD